MSSEKTEKPTAKKLKDSRKKGQVPRSKELATTALLIYSFAALLIFGSNIVDTLKAETIRSLSLGKVYTMKGSEILNYTFDVTQAVFIACIGLFSSAVFVAILGNIALGGFVISLDKLQPKLSNINPITGIKKNMFSIKQLMELIKSIIKVIIIATPAYFILKETFYSYLSTRLLFSFDSFLGNMASDIISYGLLFSSLLLFLVFIDVPFQIFNHTKQLKMSKQEIKDEYKNSEGNPEIKSRRRRVQMELASKAKNSNVIEADIIITNPTHFSVGVKFDPSAMDVPKVVALGADQYAFKIREKAREMNKPIVSIPPLARVLYKTCNIGSDIPVELYVPMSIVLGEIYKLDDRLSFKVTEEFINSLKVDEDKFN